MATEHNGIPCQRCGYTPLKLTLDDRMRGLHNNSYDGDCDKAIAEIQAYMAAIQPKTSPTPEEIYNDVVKMIEDSYEGKILGPYTAGQAMEAAANMRILVPPVQLDYYKKLLAEQQVRFTDTYGLDALPSSMTDTPEYLAAKLYFEQHPTPDYVGIDYGTSPDVTVSVNLNAPAVANNSSPANWIDLKPSEINISSLCELYSLLGDKVAIPFPHGIDVGPLLWAGLLGSAMLDMPKNTNVVHLGILPGVQVHLRMDVEDMKLHPCTCKRYSEPVWMPQHIEYALTVECPVTACGADVGCACQQHLSPHGLPFTVHRQRLERWQERHQHVMQLANQLNNDPENKELLQEAWSLWETYTEAVPNYGFCCDHIATEDFNLDDKSIQRCVDNARGKRSWKPEDKAVHHNCLAMLLFLQEFTERVRYNIIMNDLPLCHQCGHHTVEHSNYVQDIKGLPYTQRWECTVPGCYCRDYITPQT